MSIILFVYLLTSLVAGVALAGMLRTEATLARARMLLAISLAVLMVALMCVGVVSHTIARHLVQVIPALIALILVARQSPLASSAAAPILTFWLGVTINIWLFVLGIARIFTGTFSTVEIVLTIIIAAATAAGILAIVRSAVRLPASARLITAVLFGFGQLVFMIASFLFG